MIITLAKESSALEAVAFMCLSAEAANQAARWTDEASVNQMEPQPVLQ